MIHKYFNIYPKQIEAVLSEFFKAKKEKISNTLIRNMIEKIEEYTLRGGKRLRPVLMIVGYRIFGGEVTEEIIKASAMLELIQSYLLIHDDIIDESSLRRGKRTIHRILEEEYKTVQNSQKLGKDLAIVAGDLANSFAIELLENTQFPEYLKYRALIKLSNIIEYTGYGQVLDILAPYQSINMEQNLFLIHTYKTAKYTIEGPLILGGILAGGSDFSLLSKYSINVGIAFQLHDDILGLFGDESVLGKSVTSDLQEGKRTLLIIKILEHATNEEKTRLLKILGNRHITLDELNYVRELARHTGALEYSKKLANNLVEEAIKLISQHELPEKQFLQEFAKYVISREY